MQPVPQRIQPRHLVGGQPVVLVQQTARDGDEALRRLAHAWPDLLIIDIFLLNGSGLGVLQAAKDADLPVRRVVLTNYASADIRRRCAALGADRVFDKSCELDELITYCARVAEGTATAPGALG